MNSEQIELVKESFEEILPKATKVTRILYDRFFEISPKRKILFKRDMREQRKKLLKALMCLIDNLHDISVIRDYLERSANRHVEYGVKEEDYENFGSSLFFALSAAFGDDFTPDKKTAWREFYYTISGIMIKHSYYKNVVK